MESKWVIIGIHGPAVATVEGNFARVRMFLGSVMIDEDFDLPTSLPPGCPATEEVYAWFLRPAIEARLADLDKQAAAQRGNRQPRFDLRPNQMPSRPDAVPSGSLLHFSS